MQPKPMDKKDYEKVSVDDFIVGTISDIQYDEHHQWPTFEGKTKDPSEAIRFAFVLDGYKYKHYSNWMLFFYGEKTTLFSKYMNSLIENAEPEMTFDIMQLKGMRVKTLWVNKGDFQKIETIRPVDGKIKYEKGMTWAEAVKRSTTEPDETSVDDSEVPF